MMQMEKQITEILFRSQGVDVSKYDDSFLNKSLQKRIHETHCGSAEAYYTFLGQNIKEGGEFLRSLNICYSEFFRNPLTFVVLEQIILPSIVSKMRKSKRKEIRIWSAACAAGQETYSLAILLEELKKAGNENINFRIFATDQCESQVTEAQEGKYSAAALNNLNLKRVKQWFSKHGDTYNIKPELKQNIDFSVFDLLSGQYGSPPASIFGDFDLVVCANLLFYYKPEYQLKILQKAGNCLASGGYLITGETERNILLRHNFNEVYPQSAIFRRMERS
jgi:chemotaxis protein methyltransferase CheR